LDASAASWKTSGVASEAPPGEVSEKRIWSFLNVVGFSQASTPIRKLDDRDADLRDLPTRRDRRGLGLGLDEGAAR